LEAGCGCAQVAGGRAPGRAGAAHGAGWGKGDQSAASSMAMLAPHHLAQQCHASTTTKTHNGPCPPGHPARLPPHTFTHHEWFAGRVGSGHGCGGGRRLVFLGIRGARENGRHALRGQLVEVQRGANCGTGRVGQCGRRYNVWIKVDSVHVCRANCSSGGLGRASPVRGLSSPGAAIKMSSPQRPSALVNLLARLSLQGQAEKEAS
jgi:hypothetical protein